MFNLTSEIESVEIPQAECSAFWLQPTTVDLSLSSTLESVTQAEEAVRQVAGTAGFSEDDFWEIGLAVREAVANAVRHGNQFDPDKSVELRVEMQEGQLVVTVTDRGVGFDLAAVPDPLAPENMLSNHGRGLLLIRSLMDDLAIRCLESAGTEVRMSKRPVVTAATRPLNA